MKAHLSTSIDQQDFIRWLEDETRKLQLIIHMEFENEFDNTLYIWIDKT